VAGPNTIAESLPTWISERIAPLAVLAAALALLVPSTDVARRSDLLLAALVLFTALGIEPRRLLTLRRRPAALLMLSIAPILVLTAIAWVLGRAFAQPTRDGVLALGLSSSEVASVGMVALAAGDAVLALGVLTGSLIAAAVLGPALATVLAHSTGEASGTALLGRFALVVLLPLVVGLGARLRLARLGAAQPALGALSTLAVCALVYAALSGLKHAHHLGPAVVGSLAFLSLSGLVALLAMRLARHLDPPAVALPVGMRDFAVAAALATAAFGPAAAPTAGVYGVFMLVLGAGATSVLRRRTGDRASADRRQDHA